jgi:hypothetical protein
LTLELGEFNTDFLIINFQNSDAQFNLIFSVLDVFLSGLMSELDLVFVVTDFWINLLTLQVFNELFFNNVRVVRSNDI